MVESRTGCARLPSSAGPGDRTGESINDTGGEHVVPTILSDGRVCGRPPKRCCNQREHPVVVIHRSRQGVQRRSLPS